MIYIVPSYGRPHAMQDLITAWAETRTIADLCVAVDDTDPTLNDYRQALRLAPDWVSWIRVASRGMNTALNFCAMKYVNREDVIGFMGDDHRPRTHAWDAMLAAPITRDGMLITYGNDLVQGPNLPTAVAMDARVVATLGHMAPPALKHMYLDNYWRMLGERTGRMRYVHEAIVEHMHPIAGKAEWDENYVRVNDGAIYQHDHNVFTNYINDEHMLRDIELVRNL